jgi:hypothetical protein
MPKRPLYSGFLLVNTKSKNYMQKLSYRDITRIAASAFAMLNLVTLCDGMMIKSDGFISLSDNNIFGKIWSVMQITTLIKIGLLV